MLSFAKIAASASGVNTLVSGVAGKRIRVVAFVLSFSGTVNAKFQSGASGVATGDLTGLYYGILGSVAAAQPPPALPGGIQGHIETNTGEDLQLNLSAGVAVGGHVLYTVAL